jgi:hypothetical protein
MAAPAPKASQKTIQNYYAELKALHAQGVGHEMAVRMAFQALLTETGKAHRWTLIPELSLKVKGRTIRPDGTMRDDDWQLERGFWEAKDTDDDLDAEIKKKVAQGYPTRNTIFEDTRTGVLIQNGREVFRAKLEDPDQLINLLSTFYAHAEPEYDSFERAVAEFQERIPSLARALLAKIAEAHERNPKFQAAFDAMLELCRWGGTGGKPQCHPSACRLEPLSLGKCRYNYEGVG